MNGATRWPMPEGPHSVHSNRPATFMLKAVKTGECYTEPNTVYDVCLERGMDLVTITDHDTIAGALEIAHLPNAFMSEEISTFFPGDGVGVHVVALDIDEIQHAEIQRLRANIYELVGYLRAERIPHFAAHPLSRENKPLRPAHVQQLILMFRHLEGRNGTRDQLGGEALERVLDKLNHRHLIDWASVHDIEPVDWSPCRHLVAGSDDHGTLNLARAWTELDTEVHTVAALREAFDAGRLEMAGGFGTSSTLCHNIYSVTYQYFKHSQAFSAAFSGLVEDSETVKGGADPPADGTSASRRAAVVDSIRQAIEGTPDFSPLEAFENAHTDRAQEQLYRVGRKIVHNLQSQFVGGLIDCVGEIDLEGVFNKIPGLLTAGSMILPYLFGFRYLVRDRDECERLVAEMGFGYSKTRQPKVAVFNDCGYDVNGVNLGLRRMIRSIRELGHDAEMVICGTPYEGHTPDPLELDGGVRCLEPVGEFELPMYEEMRMGIPSLVDVMSYLADDYVSVVQLSTPGPLGLIACLAAKLMGIPIVAHYHTELPAFVSRITGDENIAAIARHYTGWFYRQAERVVAPSRAAARSVAELGVDESAITVLPRGIDTSAFEPGKRDECLWQRYGLNGAPKVLYVGRVSREKGLDVLLEAFERLRLELAVDAELVIVGDGPYLEQLQRDHRSPDIAFLGYRRGEELARIYASADVFTFPSENDTFGNAVLEASASGLPAVVVDRGGPMEQISAGTNGLVIPARDPAAMARAIGTLIGDEARRKRMGRSGAERIRALTLANAAEAQWELYMEVWDRRAVPRAGSSSQAGFDLTQAMECEA
ncbi:MAG: glycosyltransferase [Deltaproteobacteria bacterium]|nr:glycosyltransferase [Deltaproteobacteria bacterium]